MEFKIGDKVRVIKSTASPKCRFGVGTIGVVVDISSIEDLPFPITVKAENQIQEVFKEEELELYQEEIGGGIKMKKTFMEVSTTIKDGEIWRSKDIQIFKDGVAIRISWFNTQDDGDILIFEDELFELFREDFSFNKAFGEYEKGGVEIESVVTGNRYKKINREDMYYSTVHKEWRRLGEAMIFRAEEVRNRWYISEN